MLNNYHAMHLHQLPFVAPVVDFKDLLRIFALAGIFDKVPVTDNL